MQICNNIIIKRAVGCIWTDGIWQKCFVSENCTSYSHVVAGLLFRYKVWPCSSL